MPVTRPASQAPTPDKLAEVLAQQPEEAQARYQQALDIPEADSDIDRYLIKQLNDARMARDAEEAATMGATEVEVGVEIDVEVEAEIDAEGKAEN